MKIFLGCSEASGEHLLRCYLEELLKINPQAQITAQASHELAKDFAVIDVPFNRELCNVMGFIEPLKRLPSLLQRQLAIKKWLHHHRPQLFISFDAPDFFLPLARFARSLGVYCVHVVSPSVWAWRLGRVKTIEQSVDELHVLYSFEEAYYQYTAVKTRFIGHPLLRSLQCRQRTFPCNTLLLAPGSRIQEITANFPFFIQWAQLLRDEGFIQNVCIAVACDRMPVIESFNPPSWVRYTTLQEGIDQSQFALVCSGTASLEIVAQGCPALIIYHLAAWKRWCMQWFVHTPFIGLPNILTQRSLVPEFIGPLKTLENNILAQFRRLSQPPAYHTLASDIAESMSKLLEENEKPCLTMIIQEILQQVSMKQVEAV